MVSAIQVSPVTERVSINPGLATSVVDKGFDVTVKQSVSFFLEILRLILSFLIILSFLFFRPSRKLEVSVAFEVSFSVDWDGDLANANISIDLDFGVETV